MKTAKIVMMCASLTALVVGCEKSSADTANPGDAAPATDAPATDATTPPAEGEGEKEGEAPAEGGAAAPPAPGA